MKAEDERLDLRVRGFRLEVGGQALSNGLDLRVGPGEAVGLVGRNGSGKSLLLAAWLGWAPPGVKGTGIVALGQHLLHDSFGPCREQLDEVVGRRLAVVFSEPGLHLNPAMSAADQLGVACAQQPGSLSFHRRLEIVGLSPALLDRYPAYLSSGQRQRLAVACSLIGKGVLLCDDPAAALDPVLRAQLFHELSDQKSRADLAILVLAAREEDLPPFIDQVVELPAPGSVSRPGPGTQPWTARPAADPPRPTGIMTEAPRFGLDAPRPPALRVRNLRVRRDGEVVLHETDLEVRRGEIVLAVGESGAGKSTLLEAIARTVAVEPGSELHVLGHDLARVKPEVGRPDPPALAALRRRLRIAFQDPDTVFDAELPTSMVLERFAERSDPDLVLASRLREHLETQRGVSVGRLSGWGKRALSLWAALDRKTEILLADEPLAGADTEHLELILDGFLELTRRGTALLIVTHLLPPVARIADRVAVFQRGRLIETIAGKDLLDRATHPYTQRLVAASRSVSAGSAWRQRSRPGLEEAEAALPPLPFVPLAACSASLRNEAEPYLCAADESGRVFALEAGSWRRMEGEEAESLGLILALRGMDPETLLESVPMSLSQTRK